MTSDLIVDAISSVSLNSPVNAKLAAPAVNAVPDPDAVARFQAAMGVDGVEGVEGVKPVASVPFADQVASTWRTAQNDHQGLLHRIRALTELNGEHALSVAELSELQYNVATLSFQQEVVTKVADKASNAVQTLIKNQ
ncbi:MAG: hypothetical protein MJ106_00800 [Lentisphaeria bacterium]|nr:hypothetical protein [Lentisphaeria bacterium]